MQETGFRTTSTTSVHGPDCCVAYLVTLLQGLNTRHALAPALQAAYHTGHLGSPHLRESTSGDLSDTNVRGDLVCSGRLPRGPRK